MPNEQGYREYLAKPPHELTANTINSYCSGIRHLFNHAGIPPYSESDPNRLNEMLRRYGIGGAEAEIGSYGNGAARNALRHWGVTVNPAPLFVVCCLGRTSREAAGVVSLSAPDIQEPSSRRCCGYPDCHLGHVAMLLLRV